MDAPPLFTVKPLIVSSQRQPVPTQLGYKKMIGSSLVWRLFGVMVVMNAVMIVVVGLTLSQMLNQINMLKNQMNQTNASHFEGSDDITKRSLPSPQLLLQHTLPGTEALQVIGSIPVIRVNKNGTIGPWQQTTGHIDWATLSPDESGIVIQNSGLYFVYAQMFYLTNEDSNSYEVVREPGNTANVDILTICANQVSAQKKHVTGAAEVSCYTGVVTMLAPNDRLSLHQVETNRVILSSQGYSHWGLIRLHQG